ncbi:hypothetical protein D3C78_1746620 [compost metagenome]
MAIDEFRMEPKNAIKIVPPRLRNSVDVAVTTPSCEAGAEFCAAVVKTGILKPNPIPNTTILTMAIPTPFMFAIITILALMIPNPSIANNL